MTEERSTLFTVPYDSKMDGTEYVKFDSPVDLKAGKIYMVIEHEGRIVLLGELTSAPSKD